MNPIFTFHYASTLSSGEQSLAVVVINLHSTMLLLYLFAKRSTISYSLFTFHYASTLSDEERLKEVCSVDLHSTMLLLYRIMQEYPSGNRSHLHSTMLLLYLMQRVRLGEINPIYIPLCFYFIFNPASSIIFPTLFTFHYASTLSVTDMRISFSVSYLHSTMLLLYQRTRMLRIQTI